MKSVEVEGESRRPERHRGWRGSPIKLEEPEGTGQG